MVVVIVHLWAAHAANCNNNKDNENTHHEERKSMGKNGAVDGYGYCNCHDDNLNDEELYEITTMQFMKAFSDENVK